MSINRPFGTLLALAVVVALAFVYAGSSRAQSVSPRERLASVKSITCEFPRMATGNWSSTGEPQVEIKPSGKFSLHFEKINTEEGSAEMAGSFGKFDIVVHLTEGTLHLIQMFRSGALYTTTVFPKVNRAGKLKAVHSRHEYLDPSMPGFTSRPEQYYGECAIVGG